MFMSISSEKLRKVLHPIQIDTMHFRFKPRRNPGSQSQHRSVNRTAVKQGDARGPGVSEDAPVQSDQGAGVVGGLLDEERPRRALQRARHHLGGGTLVDRIQRMVPIRRPPKFTRTGARCAVMPSHHEHCATHPVSLGGRPVGPESRLLGASETLDDAVASPANSLLPRRRDSGSYGYHMLDFIH